MARVTQNSPLLISEAADTLGVSVDTVRRWEKKGLIRAERGERGERRFDRKSLEALASKGVQASKWRILRADRSELRSIELFCGAGGLALGMHNAGFRHELLVDFDKNSIETVADNMPKWNTQLASVADIDLSEYKGQIDVMAGGFPCQAFSYAGNGRGFGDARGTLFFEFARLIDQVKPRLVIGENVRGLVRHDHGRTLQTMVGILADLGYSVRYSILRSQFLDVPQKRERLVIFALRNSETSPIVFPSEKNYLVPLREALLDVPSSAGASYPAAKHRILAQVPPGGYWRDLPPDDQKKYMGGSFHLSGGKTGMARRLSWDEPSLTLTCSPAQKQTERCHPAETRPLSVREYARIQTFPDSWAFSGSVASQYRQIGNAVPVNLGYHIGLAAREILGVPAKRAQARSKVHETIPVPVQPELEGFAA
jgi:DNA (cytosine-5)-methyltransferase 1